MSSSGYDVPSWAGKPATGLHLDVLKDGKLIQKLMIDEKKCYLFGRNPQMNDFCVDHNSCSRVHSALVYHKNLSRAFLVDLGSTHGTYIGNVRLEKHKPTQLPVDSSFHFGASTRKYLIRERPQAGPRPIMEELERSAASDSDGRLMGLPETESELDNLTEFNTAHNRRITMIGIPNEQRTKPRKIRITFNEEEIIINPEDVDPSVGRFRNMVESTIIPKKRPRNDMGIVDDGPIKSKRPQPFTSPTKMGLYDDLATSPISIGGGLFASSLSSKLGLPLPNPAPDIDMAAPPMLPPPANLSASAAANLANLEAQFEDPDEPKKKKYAKEAWPGKKPVPSLLV